MRFTTKKMVVCGLLVAIGIIMKLYFASVPLVIFGSPSKIPFSFMIIYICGFVGGPVLGAISGVLIDILATLLSGQAPLLGLSATSAVLGLVAGLIYMIPKNNQWKPMLIILAVVVGQLLCSVVLNPLVLWLNGQTPGKSFYVVAAGKLLQQAFYIPALAFIECIIMKTYDKLDKKTV